MDALRDDVLRNDIQEINLSYLVLAQRMSLSSTSEAMLRLGMSTEMVELFASLTVSQLLKLASSNQILCQFRFDDHTLLSVLSHNISHDEVRGKQVSMLLVHQPVHAL
ncbi:flagellar transcriptional regulator FlhD [Paraburkholderia sp. BR10937]|uniref:flagellar transcriptional regulator FlhD n=1 Tax=Paraburkholderia sp. BR10937 TaxID=3236994 RepID=UPI0034D2E273